ncbi:LOW QUALITY PROTEIN: hypothetical protein Ct61P_03842 [Colletotrichum tofieldiae]|nr:LOW QUALITY PROTEIN: hypothetical protein Ct61P_03842 [Colletotrichum tofieldiae]
MYSCATSAPATGPVFLTVAVTVATMSKRSARPPGTTWPTAGPDFAVEVTLMRECSWCMLSPLAWLQVKNHAEGGGALTQPETELVPRLDAGLVKVAVVDEDALGKVVLASPGYGGAVVGGALANGVRQLSVGVRRAPEHVDERVAGLLRPQPGPHHGLDARLREDRLEDDGPRAVDHDDDVLVRRGHGAHELVAVVPRVQGVAVANVAVDGDVPLARVGRDEDEGRVRAGRRRGALLRVVAAARRDRGAVLRRPRPHRVQRRHEVGVVDCARPPPHPEGARVAAAVVAGVDAGRVVDGRGADDGDLFRFSQGQGGVVVLEEHDAVPGRRAHVLLVVALDVGAEVDGRVRALVLAEQVPRREDPADLVVEGRQRNLAVLHGRLELRAPPHRPRLVVVVGAGHHHVKPRVGAADRACGGEPCFAVAWTPTDCMPSIVSLVAMPMRGGQLTLPKAPHAGPSMTCTPTPLASVAFNAPRSRIKSTSHVAAAWIPGTKAVTLLA